MATTLTGSGIALGFSCSPKFSKRPSSSSSNRRCIKMSVSVEEKTKNRQCCQEFNAWRGPAIIGHADDEVLAALAETMKKGTSFGAPCLLENVLAEMVISAVTGVCYSPCL